MIRSKELKYAYPGKQEIVFPDVDIAQGEHYLILGNSGCGKTTFLHLLSGLLTSKSGEFFIAGQNFNKIAESKKDDFRGKNIGIVFQSPHFINAISVEENLFLTQKMAGLKINKPKVADLLSSLNLTHKAKDLPSELSQGEKQRVSIARAVVNEPKIIFADEPTSALDDVNCDEVLNLLESQAKSTNASLVIVTHDNRLKEHFKNRISLSPL